MYFSLRKNDSIYILLKNITNLINITLINLITIKDGKAIGKDIIFKIVKKSANDILIFISLYD